MSDWQVDRGYLTGVQYSSDANLAARQSIYRYLQQPVKIAEWALDLARLAGDERILDLGCGNGLYLAELARREHRGTVCGADLSLGMLAAAHARSGAALLVADAQRLPFADDSFDRVLAIHMLYHVPDRDLCLSEIRRVLRPGGLVLALTNSYRHLEELNDMVVSVLHEVLGAATTRTYLRFSSESGADDLASHFAEVERHDNRNQLVVTDVQPVVDYVASMGTVGAPIVSDPVPVLREVERRVRTVIETDGAFRIRTDVGCFVCR